MDDERYRRGWEKLKEIDGEAGERVIASLQDIAPDLARYTIEFPFGDVYLYADIEQMVRAGSILLIVAVLAAFIPVRAVTRMKVLDAIWS